MSRKHYNARGIIRKQFYILTGVLVVCVAGFTRASMIPEDKGEYAEVTAEQSDYVSGITCDVYIDKVAEQKPHSEEYRDPNNSLYPYNTMSADWGAELYESGFKYFDIPQSYKNTGGCFPEVVQAYLWSLCKERGIDYYIVVALIERESGYKWDRVGDDGNSKGYMQIYEKWHCDRMEAEGVTDLYNPYENIRVGLNYLQEIQNKYLSSSGVNCVLMVYNMGESTAKKNWSNGTYSTEYSKGIVSRAQEIEQELQD